MSDDPPPWFKKFMQQLVGAEEPEQTSSKRSNDNTEQTSNKHSNNNTGQTLPAKTLKTSSKARGPPPCL